jgi:hypothetical protein
MDLAVAASIAYSSVRYFVSGARTFDIQHFEKMIMDGLGFESSNNSPEPPPNAHLVPHSRLTDLAARLSFCR